MSCLAVGCDLVGEGDVAVTSKPADGRVSEDSVGWMRTLADAAPGNETVRWEDDAGAGGAPGSRDASVEQDGGDGPEVCERACLGGLLGDFLNALAAHDLSGLPLSSAVTLVEDGQEKPLAEGAWQYITGLAGYQQDILDVPQGIAGAHVVVQAGEALALLVVWLKVVDYEIVRIELQLARSSADTSGRFEPASLSAPSEALAVVPPATALHTRQQLFALAGVYVEALRLGSFSGVGLPLVEGALAVENGRPTAGPGCMPDVEACVPLHAQLLAGKPGLQAQMVAVDETQALIWLRLSWGSGTMPDPRETAWTLLKAYGDQVHAVEVFSKRVTEAPP
jgi:hypothetical protein